MSNWTRYAIAEYTDRDYDDPTWGVPDPLPRYWGEMCPTEHPDGPVCTRPTGHTGRHAASNGEVIIAVWEVRS